VLLGIAQHDKSRASDRRPDEPAPLLLEPWAVKAAIRRTRRKLSLHELKEAMRCARDDETIRWPEPGEE